MCYMRITYLPSPEMEVEEWTAMQFLETRAAAVSESDFIDLMTETLQNRQAYAWSQAIPMGTAVGIHFATLATSPNTTPLGLLSIAELLLTYIKDAQGLNKENENTSAEDLADAASMLVVFEAVFKRVIGFRYHPTDRRQVETMYNAIWKFHTRSQIDFSETDVINTLLQKRPRFLEPLFTESLRRWNPAILAPICSQHNYSFQMILDYIRQSYDRNPETLPRILEYTHKFLEATSRLLENDGTRVANCGVKTGAYPLLIKLYPDQLHPILHLIVQLETIAISEETTKALTVQLYKFMDEIYGYAPDERSILSFIFRLYEPTKKIIGMTDLPEIKMKTYPHLWQVLNNIPIPAPNNP